MAEAAVDESRSKRSWSDSDTIAGTVCRREGHSINMSLGHGLLCTKCGKSLEWIRGDKPKEDGNGKGS